MKYRVFDIDNKAEYTKEMSFDDEGKWYYIMYVL